MNNLLFRLGVVMVVLLLGYVLWKGVSRKQISSRQKVWTVPALHHKAGETIRHGEEYMVKGVFVNKQETAKDYYILLGTETDSLGNTPRLRCRLEESAREHMQNVQLKSELVLSGKLVRQNGETAIEEARLISMTSPEQATQ